MTDTPQTLIEAVEYFSNPKVCFEAMLPVKWPDGKPACPKCGHGEVYVIRTRAMLQCKFPTCKKQFSVKVGTIFEDSPLPLQKWFVAIWAIANAKNGISSYELGRALGVTQKTAWFMLHRVRLAMKTRTFRKLNGEVESDETYIGGKAAAWRFNFRDLTDGLRFQRVLAAVVGKRLTYRALTAQGDAGFMGLK